MVYWIFHRNMFSSLLPWLRISALIIAGGGHAFAAGDKNASSKYEHWITGDIITTGSTLLFYTEKPVEGDTTRSLVLLATPASLAHGFLPMYAAAAKRKVPLRLYGKLTHTDLKTFPGAPPVTFMPWKIHLATDPDVLPRDQVVYVKPEPEGESRESSAPLRAAAPLR